jgi:hypothetical protein
MIKAKKLKLPFLVKLVAVFTIISCIGGKFILNFRISGLGWFVPLIFALVILLGRPGKIKYPLKIWLPWILVVIIYQYYAEAPVSLQRSVMLLCPIIVGITVSKYSVEEKEIEDFKRLYKYMAIALIIVVLIKTGIIFTGVLPFRTGLAAEVMVGALLCCLFAGSYAYGRKKDLLWWTTLAAIPVIAVTRMGMIAASLSLPMTLAPMKVIKRFIFIIVILIVGVNIFFTERIQEKMFYSGSGTLQDLRWDNPDFATTGRRDLWAAIEEQIDRSPWFGHGANASEEFVRNLTGGLTHPHNDWLRLLYDYGYFGTSIFGLCLLMQLLSLFSLARKSKGILKTLLYAGASSILVFVLFMFTDNIILYAAFFGNMQFIIFGLAYSAYKTQSKHGEQSVAPAVKKRIRIRW